MNKQIQELALQAFREAALFGGKQGDKDFDTRYNQKFAELIVRECMEQVWFTKEDYINENISEVIKERMKQHFGVEE